MDSDVKFAVVEDGTWTGEIVDDPRKHADQPIASPAKIRDYTREGFYPIRVEEGDPADSEKKVGYEYVLDEARGKMRKVAQYETKSVEEYAQDLIKEVKRRREEAAKQDVTINGETYSATDRAVRRIIGAAQRANANANWSSVIPTTDSKYPELTGSEAKAIRDAIAQNLENALANEKEKVSQINAADTIDDLDAIDLTTGWP